MRTWLGVALFGLAACGATEDDELFGRGPGEGGGGGSVLTTGTGASGAATGTTSTDTSTSTSTTTTTPTEACPASGPCETCLLQACPARYCNCAANAACPELIACAGSCTDDDCERSCYGAYGDGISDAALLSDCAASHCQAQEGCAIGRSLSPCEVCVFASCELPANACLSNAECVSLLSCWQGCSGGSDCLAECAEKHPGATAEATKLLQCAKSHCSQCDW